MIYHKYQLYIHENKMIINICNDTITLYMFNKCCNDM